MATYLYIGLAGLLYMLLSAYAIMARRKHLVAYGHGPKNIIAGPISAHSNFSAYVPMLFLLLFFYEQTLENTNLPIHLYGSAILLGRVSHFLSLAFFEKRKIFRFRQIGMVLTFIPLVGLSLRLIVYYFSTNS